MTLKGLKRGLNLILYLQLTFLIGFFLFPGCASIQQPKGGPKDTIPPKIVRENPKNLTRNFKGNKIEIQFDEFFKLNNEFKEISVSPAMEQNPTFRIKRHVLEIKLLDTLEKNTTYSINFGKSIADINEGNILRNYTYVFATGNVIDSLSISGKVTDFITKEPVLDATVFIIPIKQDSIFGKRRASIFTSTDSAGNYTLKNLRSDTYRVYAIKEEGGGDRIYNNPSKEEIGFIKDSLILTKDTANINLQIFKGEPPVFRVIERKIENTGRILMTFNKGIEKPDLQIINPIDLNAKKILEFSKKADSAMFWLPEMTFDSLTVITKSGNINLDTVVIRRNKRDTYNQSITITDNLQGGRLKPGKDMVLTFSAPVSAFDISKIKLLEDSVARKVEIIKDTSSFRKYLVKYRWRNKKEYILDLAENAFTNSFGGKSKATTRRFSLEDVENYGSLILDITIPDTSKSYIVQLIRDKTEVLSNDIIRSNKKLTYDQYQTGTYTVRVIYDLNKNGKWDTGDVFKRREPEPIWNSPKSYTLRANWDLEEKISIPPLK